MKNILITTDFSSHSRHTIEYVLNFMKETQIPCRILLVNTYLVPQTDPGQVIKLNDELKKISKKGLEEEKQFALNQISNSLIEIETASHIGTLSNVISNLIKREKINLVAVGDKGGRKLDKIAALLKEKDCPLLLTYFNESKSEEIHLALP